MTVLLQVLATPGVDRTLTFLMSSSVSAFERSDLENMFLDYGAHAPGELFDHLLDGNIIQAIGTRFALSQNGRKTSLLMQAINGADLNEIYQRIRRVDGDEAAYQLVREGMTSIFFNSLSESPGVGTLYICSPWINPTEKQERRLMYAALMQEKRTGTIPDILIVTRPAKSQPPGTENGLETFRKLKAKIYYNKRVHSKLYIREPDFSGGAMLAIVGSQNLTRSRMLELGILIRGDDQVINQLVRHFVDLTNASTEE